MNKCSYGALFLPSTSVPYHIGYIGRIDNFCDASPALLASFGCRICRISKSHSFWHAIPCLLLAFLCGSDDIGEIDKLADASLFLTRVIVNSRSEYISRYYKRGLPYPSEAKFCCKIRT
jgi:hypothetical protein